MKVGQIASRRIVSAAASESLATIARLMYEHHVGLVAITKCPADRPVVVGVITDRDIAKAQLERTADLSRLSAEETMTREPLVLNEDEPVANAVRHLHARGVRRAPVVSQHGALTGILSTDDLLASIAKDLFVIAQLEVRQPAAERGPCSGPGPD